jgi:sirohydrochlorin ferrochelatase
VLVGGKNWRVRARYKRVELIGMKTFLVDNGSLRADSVLALRRVAAELTRCSGVEVEPLSILHSSRIPPTELENKEALVLRDVVQQALQQGESHLRLVPFFLGPSNALQEYIPLMADEWFRRGELRIDVAHPIVRNSEDAQCLSIAVEEAAGEYDPLSQWILVDHGTPRKEVNQVRNWVQQALRQQEKVVHACSMESREGDQYAFNLPLLQDCLRNVLRTGSIQSLQVALLFLSPGRHAGVGGDVDRLCRQVMVDFPQVHWRFSNVLGESPVLLQLLSRRLYELETGDYWFSVS